MLERGGAASLVLMGPVNDFAPIPCNLEPVKGLKQGRDMVVLNLSLKMRKMLVE